MAKTKISEYSTTNASNTDIESINIDEGCAPSGINNAIRELMVHLKEFQTGASGDPLTVAGTFVASGTATLNGTSIPASKTLATTADTNTFTVPQIISANSSSDALRITQTGAGNALVVEDSTNPDSTPFVVAADGNVIVGSTSTRISTNRIEVNDTGGANYAIGVNNWNSTNSFGPALNLIKSQSGTVGTNGVVSAGAFSQINFRFDDGTTFLAAASIAAAVDGTPGTNDMPGRLIFSTTADGASSPTERMRIGNAGNVGIGAAGLLTTTLRLAKTITGGVESFGVIQSGVVQSDVTTNAYGFRNVAQTAASAFTVTGYVHYQALQSTIGAGSSITNQYGFIASSTLIGATNNYGFYSDIASGTGRWNFYANGTAENYLGGNLKIGATDARGTTAGTNHLSIFNGTAPAGTLTNGVTLYSSSGDLNFMDSVGNGYKVGYRNVPAVGTKTGSYTLAVGDVGKYVQVGSGGSITIPDATFAEGDIVSVFNNTSGNITITCTITTAYIAGTDSDKASVTLATRGVATILFISGTVCVISGNVS